MRVGLYSQDHGGCGSVHRETGVITGYLLSHLFLQWLQPAPQCDAHVLCGRLSSSSCIAAEERIEHGLLHTLLVLPTPCNHCPITVGCV